MIYISDWEGLVVDAGSASEYSPLQPVPYVDELTELGVLTIRWDRDMQEIRNLTILPPTEVMIRESVGRRRLTVYTLGDSIDGRE